MNCTTEPPRDTNPLQSRTRHANATHDPPIPVTFRWRCCRPFAAPPVLHGTQQQQQLQLQLRLQAAQQIQQPAALAMCAQVNTTTATTHFVPAWVSRERVWVWVPGYRVARCRACGHAACDDCEFLEVNRTAGVPAPGTGPVSVDVPTTTNSTTEAWDRGPTQGRGEGQGQGEGETERTRAPWDELGIWDREEGVWWGRWKGIRASDRVPDGRLVMGLWGSTARD